MRRYFIVTLGILAAIWALGLWLFVADIKNLDEIAPAAAGPDTDAIIVLTGGSERLKAGLDLLGAHKAKKLLISGVHPGLTLEHLLAPFIVDRDLRECCIILGHAAGSTVGNAEETLLFMQAEDFHSLRVVTANYHMPRSLLLFHEAMPEYDIVPYPVSPDSVKLDQWWTRSGTASLLVTEYVKYLVALFEFKFGIGK